MPVIVTSIIRGVQVLSAAVVLGISIALIRNQNTGSVALINFASFTGGFGILVALVGLAAMFIEPLAGLIIAGLDALAAAFFLAGGIAIAVKIRGISCSSGSDANIAKLWGNDLTNGGCVEYKGNKLCGQSKDNNDNDVDKGYFYSRCTKNSADSAFMIISAVLCLGMAVMALVAMKRASGRKGVVV